MKDEKFFLVLAFYYFIPIEHPEKEVAKHHAFFETRDIKSRIYISEEGINGQMSGVHSHIEEYMEWMRGDDRFKEIDFKIHYHDEHVFAKTTVKVRKQLVALDVEVDVEDGGEHVSPKKWKEMLEARDGDTLLLDVRNDYEWKIGHFEGSELPRLEMFRQFPSYAKKLREERDPEKTKVMMYCTGGIRCELYSAMLKKEGFQNVFQLEGGVIKYGLEEGSKHWKGKLFVFDDRLAVPISEEEPAESISFCHHCKQPSDAYYNCANMDCNELFLCCLTCAEKFLGCCSEECRTAPRVRPYQKTDRPKPFRKWSHYEKED